MKPTPRPLVTALLVTTLAGAAAAHAGTVYIPLPGVATVGNATYEMQVFVTNTTAQSRTVKSLHLATLVDGTKRPGLKHTATPVAAGQTVILKPDGTARGLLELDAPDGVEYSARLVSTGSAAGLGVELPVITSDNIGHAGKKLVVQNLDGSAAVKTSVVMVNLSQAKAACSARVYQASGTATNLAIQSMPFEALSHVSFTNVFAALGDIADARVEVSCTGDFYAYAQLTNETTGEFAVSGPSGGSDSALSVPGDNAALTCAPGAWCHTVPGLVHQSTGANPDHSIVLSPPVFAYSKVRLHLEVELNGFAAPASGAHGVAYFIRDGNKDMYANIFLRGGGKNDITLRHGFNQTHGQKAKIQQGISIQDGGRYHFDYLFDPVAKLITLTVSLNGQVVTTLNSKPNVNRAHIDAGQKVILGLSNPHVGDAVEPASIGWRYHNVHVEFIP
jgi:hypothetical protein